MIFVSHIITDIVYERSWVQFPQRPFFSIFWFFLDHRLLFVLDLARPCHKRGVLSFWVSIRERLLQGSYEVSALNYCLPLPHLYISPPKIYWSSTPTRLRLPNSQSAKAKSHSTSCITIWIYVQACMQAIKTSDASTCPRPTLTAGLLYPSFFMQLYMSAQFKNQWTQGKYMGIFLSIRPHPARYQTALQSNNRPHARNKGI